MTQTAHNAEETVHVKGRRLGGGTITIQYRGWVWEHQQIPGKFGFSISDGDHVTGSWCLYDSATEALSAMRATLPMAEDA